MAVSRWRSLFHAAQEASVPARPWRVPMTTRETAERPGFRSALVSSVGPRPRRRGTDHKPSGAATALQQVRIA